MLFVRLSQIVAPYGGKLEKTGPREVTITVNEMKSVKATISNVDLNVDETEASLRDSDMLICLSLTSRKLNPNHFSLRENDLLAKTNLASILKSDIVSACCAHDARTC